MKSPPFGRPFFIEEKILFTVTQESIGPYLGVDTVLAKDRAAHQLIEAFPRDSAPRDPRFTRVSIQRSPKHLRNSSMSLRATFHSEI
jgi:hypothetical protein